MILDQGTENLITPNSFDNLDNIYDANNNIISKVKTDVKKTNSNREIHKLEKNFSKILIN